MANDVEDLSGICTDKLLERFTIAAGNLALAHIGAASGTVEEYEAEVKRLRAEIKSRAPV